MNPIVTEFVKFLAREIAGEVAKHVSDAVTAKPAKPAKTKKEKAEASLQESEAVMHVDVAADRSDDEWRADCLGIINLLAPTHGRELRALLGKFDAKRLSEVTAAALPSLLSELAILKDGK